MTDDARPLQSFTSDFVHRSAGGSRRNVQVETSGDGEVSYRARINGRIMEVIYSPRCSVCRSEVLPDVHDLIVQDVPLRKILDMLPTDSGISYQSLVRHTRNHLPNFLSSEGPLRAALVALGRPADSGEVDGEVLLGSIVEHVFAGLVRDEIELKASDGISAVKALREIRGDDEAAENVLQYAQALNIVFREVQAQLEPDAFDQLMWKIRSNPEMIAVFNSVGGAAAQQAPAARKSDQIDHSRSPQRELASSL